ncbi:MAG: tetratricopeptide repeat protein [Gemmataceae bacterium]|nr:tetratricopeptide repeat protein [Gemmataceae bacterium]
MDCRRSLLAAMCLLGACAGCVTQPMVPGGSADTLASVAAMRPSSGGKRKPSAELCTAYGKFCERGAEQTDNPEQQQVFRDEARKSYQKALELDPKYAHGYRGLASLYLQLNNHEQAVATYRKGLDKLPKEASLWGDLGICHCRRKDWKPALECLQKAHALEPENREIGTQYGLALARAGRLNESVTVLAKVVGRAQAHYNVACMARHLNQPAAAKDHLRQTLQASPNHTDAQQLLAQLNAEPQAGQGVVRVGFRPQ